MSDEFIKVPKVILTKSGEHRKKEDKLIWYCNQCKNYIDVSTFIKGSFDMVNLICEIRKIYSTHGRLYICPHCYSIIHYDGRGEYIKIDNNYKEKLIAKCDFFKGRDKK